MSKEKLGSSNGSATPLIPEVIEKIMTYLPVTELPALSRVARSWRTAFKNFLEHHQIFSQLMYVNSDRVRYGRNEIGEYVPCSDESEGVEYLNPTHQFLYPTKNPLTSLWQLGLTALDRYAPFAIAEWVKGDRRDIIVVHYHSGDILARYRGHQTVAKVISLTRDTVISVEGSDFHLWRWEKMAKQPLNMKRAVTSLGNKLKKKRNHGSERQPVEWKGKTELLGRNTLQAEDGRKLDIIDVDRVNDRRFIVASTYRITTYNDQCEALNTITLEVPVVAVRSFNQGRVLGMTYGYSRVLDTLTCHVAQLLQDGLISPPNAIEACDLDANTNRQLHFFINSTKEGTMIYKNLKSNRIEFGECDFERVELYRNREGMYRECDPLDYNSFFGKSGRLVHLNGDHGTGMVCVDLDPIEYSVIPK